MRCSSGACVLVEITGDRVLVRDSKLGEESPVHPYGLEEWAELLEDIRDDYCPAEWWRVGGDVMLWSRAGITLKFTVDEIEEFEAGVKEGKFDVEAPA